jgi:nucleoside triphosphate pyrophosphatase
MRIVLASESEGRRRALDLLGVEYEVRPAGIDEQAIRNPDPVELTRRLAEAKARVVAESEVARRDGNALVVAGDAVVEKNGRIFEKPRDLDEAAEFLRELCGDPFRFVTSVVVLRTDTQKMLSAVEVSEIRFRQLGDREMREYVGRYPVLRCAGAFEGEAVLRFAESVSGSYNFMTGMPVSRLAVFLREMGVEV